MILNLLGLESSTKLCSHQTKSKAALSTCLTNQATTIEQKARNYAMFLI